MSLKLQKLQKAILPLSDGASYVGTYFDTTYTMTGTVTDFIKAKDVLMASILDDFSKSPTIRDDK